MTTSAFGWYLVECTPGREALVRELILDRVAGGGFGHQLRDVGIPTIAITTIRQGKNQGRRETTLGCLLLEMQDDPGIRDCISGIPGISGWVADTALSEEQINRYLAHRETQVDQL